MRQGIWTIISNEELAPKVWRMRLQGDTEDILPGQFVDIAIPGQFLRRPISVCDVEGDVLTLIYKVVGVGTDKMSGMAAGQMLDILTALGQGYQTEAIGETKPLLIGGGVGVPPLYYLAKTLGGQCTVILGFNTKSEVFYESEFRALGCEVHVTTADGTYGTKGFVTNIDADGYYFACGPRPMLKAIVSKWGTRGQMSMEERMGCGFGICVGCTIQTTDGNKRVCKDGPVFDASNIKWD